MKEAQNLPGKAADVSPYVILWQRSSPKAQHKSGKKEKTLSPTFLETFAFVQSPTFKAFNDDCIVFQCNAYQKIGSPKPLGEETNLPLSGITLDGTNFEFALDITGAPGAKLLLEVSCLLVPASEVPELKYSHTGGSKQKYYNSVDRTVGKKRIRTKQRDEDEMVPFIEVTVVKATALVSTQTNLKPYFFIHLNSSAKNPKKSTIKRGNNPLFQQTFGFEIASLKNDMINDELRIQMKGYNSPGLPAYELGSVKVPLSSIEADQTVSGVYDVLGPDGKNAGQVEVSVKRRMASVLELDADDGLIASLSKKLVYAIKAVQYQLAKMGLKCTISTSILLAVIELELSVTLNGMPEDEFALRQLKNVAEEAGDEVAGDEVDQGDTSGKTSTLTVTGVGKSTTSKESGGFAKNMIDRCIKSVIASVSSTSRQLAALGITGSVKVGAHLGADFYGQGIEFVIAVQLDIGA